MRADRTYLRRCGAYNDVSAVAALPHLDIALFEHLSCLNIVQQRAVALLMLLFNGAYKAEFFGKFRESQKPWQFDPL